MSGESTTHRGQTEDTVLGPEEIDKLDEELDAGIPQFLSDLDGTISKCFELD
jgi:hypothetical protein